MPRWNIVIGIMLLGIIALGAVTSVLSPVATKSLNTLFSISNEVNRPFDIDDNTSANFISENKFCMVGFYLPNCGLCKEMNNTTSELAKELNGQIAYGKINVLEYRLTSKKYGIGNFPTVLLFSNGTLVKKLRYNSSRSDIIEALRGLKPSLDMSGVKLANANNIISNWSPEYILLNNQSEDKPTMPLKVTEDNIDLAIQKYSYLVLDGYTAWCEPCKDMSDVLESLSAELQGQVAFGMINISENNQIKARYNITSYPTLLVYKDGKLINRSIGYRSEPTFSSWLKGFYLGLNMSKVKLASTQNAPMNWTPEYILLTNLSGGKPTEPMMVTDSNIGLAMQKYHHLVLDGYTVWCEPCKDMSVVLKNLSEELQGQVAFGMIDVEKNKQIKNQYNITSYPTLFIYTDGKLINRSIGYRSKTTFTSWLKAYYPDIDTSKVKLQSARDSTKTAQGVPREIPLVELGTENPTRPMLITDSTIDSAVKQYPFLVVEGFANWCDFSAQMNQTMLNLSSELHGQVAFGVIDAERNNLSRDKYNLTAYPTTIIFRNGTMVKTVPGYQKKSSFVNILKQIDPKLNTSNVTVEKTAPFAPPMPKLTPEQACANMTKSDQPLLVAYVVSHCPFGLQMQRIMANITDSIPESSKYMEVRYIGSAFDNGTITSMHGKDEAQENLRQICIREEQPSKYWDYVKCYMKEGKTEECLKSTSVDIEQLDACTNDTSRGAAYARKDFDVANNYSITGSPTLMMNGKIVSESDFGTNTTSSRSPEAIKELLCCGFKTEPYFCSEQLNKSRAPTMYSAK